MKFLAAILVFMIAAQTVQAGFCDMQPSGDASAHADMQHAGTHKSHMQHAGMQQKPAAAHDCCAPGEPGDSEPGGQCGNHMACGFCAVGLSAIAAFVPALAVWNTSDRPVMTEGRVVTGHASPPYRPPIDLS